jgi:hypothetical protein
MIGGLDIVEKKLMIVTSRIDGPGPLSMLPDDYKKSIKTREGAYVLDVTEELSRSNVGSFDEQFVSKVIAAAEKTKPEAIYWLHWTLYSEHSPTIDRLISWLAQSGIPLYISSWARAPSPQLQSAVQASKGEYEQRTITRSPPVVIRTTPEGTDYIKDSLKQKNQWNPNMQEEKGLWRGYLTGLIDRPSGKPSDLGKTIQSRGVHFSVLGSSGSVPLFKEQIARGSWESVAESWQEQRVGWRRSDVMIIAPRGSPTGSYIVKKDPKTGQWTRQLSPTIDDLVDK